MLETRIRKLETLTRRRQLVVYENDWRGNRPNPTPEALAAPDVDILRIRYVSDWPAPAEPLTRKPQPPEPPIPNP